MILRLKQIFLLSDYIFIYLINLFMCLANCESFQYIQHNLHEYCTDRYWSDFPGHKTISAEKSLQIRNPLIFNFNTNNSNRFVSYCVIRLIATEGKRIYAVGTSSGISTNGKHWFTESLHFTPTRHKLLTKVKIKEDFERTTDNNALELIFEQLGDQEFKFQLIVTPFRSIGNETYCAKDVEFKCFNNRCIDKYLICDNHNNCGDSSDEWHHCLTKLETDTQTEAQQPTTPLTTTTTKEPVLRPTLSKDYKSPETTKSDNFFINLFKTSLDLQTILFYILIVLLIIIVVTLINLIIWCLVTKRDQSFLDLSA